MLIIVALSYHIAMMEMEAAYFLTIVVVTCFKTGRSDFSYIAHTMIYYLLLVALSNLHTLHFSHI